MKTLSAAEIRGNWATLLLATSPDGAIDYSRMADEIDVLIDAKPNGIYSNGTAGEFYSQTPEEFCRICELLACKCEAADVPFQIGVSHPSADVSLERLLVARLFKPSAVQVILPDWFPVTNREAINFLERMQSEAGDVNLVLYNPPHAKRRLAPEDFAELKKAIPTLVGIKVFDNNRDKAWYEAMRTHAGDLSIFVPGHHLATGVTLGASGAYSNVACINPRAAQLWWEMMAVDMPSALELEGRINEFMSRCITPFIVRDGFPNHACDRFMALVGGWADVGERLRWPYESIPAKYVQDVRAVGRDLIPEFFTK